jgi:translation elongation factor EF-G
VKCGSAIRRRRKFRRIFPGNIVPSTRGFHELTKTVWTTRALLDKKYTRKRRVLAKEKIDEIGAKLDHTPQKSQRSLAQETDISKPLNPHLIHEGNCNSFKKV